MVIKSQKKFNDSCSHSTAFILLSPPNDSPENCIHRKNPPDKICGIKPPSNISKNLKIHVQQHTLNNTLPENNRTCFYFIVEINYIN